MPSLPYKKVLVIGATSGIGEALAVRFIETGTSVIVVGRRQENLDTFMKAHGDNGSVTVDSAAFDITDLKAIPHFANEMFSKHPDIDAVLLNSGIQRKLDWSDLDSVDLDMVELELKTNYTAYLHLTKAFLRHLQKQAPKETALMYTTSGLALIPSLHCPNYSSSKAALHHMILAMREQLRAANSNIRIIEILPPAVQTELHDFEMGNKGQEFGIPLKDFVDEAFAGLCKSGTEVEQIPVSGVKGMGYSTWEQDRQQIFIRMNENSQHRKRAD